MVDLDDRPVFSGRTIAFFRDQVRSFLAREIAPQHDQWEREGVVSRDAWLKSRRGGPAMCLGGRGAWRRRGDFLHKPKSLRGDGADGSVWPRLLDPFRDGGPPT